MSYIYYIFILLTLTSCVSIQPISKLPAQPSSPSTQDSAVDSIDKVIVEFNDQNEEELLTDQQADNTIEELIEEEVASHGVHLPSPDNFIDIIVNDSVKFWINYFTVKDRARFQRFINNGEKYRQDIEKIFAQHKIPRELFFVGLIESGFYLKAKSHAKAVGPWQFIKGTGKRYGLIISQNLDERKDLYKATHAAARYLKDLYKIFGNWELALSGYNAGESRIVRQMKKSRISDYHELARRGYLPKETAQYVPKVIATMIIYKNHEQYGFKIEPQPNPFADTETINLSHSLPIYTVEKMLQMPPGTVKKLNPELISQQTPFFKTRKYQLRLPKSKVRNNPKTVAKISQMRGQVSYRTTSRRLSSSPTTASMNTYQVRRGDTLSQIAAASRVSIQEIKQLNKLRNHNLRVGQRIKLPINKHKVYVVRRGDNLFSIAKNYGKSTKELIVLNNLHSSGKIYPGQKLIITQ